MNSRCPYTDTFTIGTTEFDTADIIDRLSPLVRRERIEKFQQVIGGRTYSIVPVLEGLYDRGNTSAVLRSAEALGYQMVHLVESSGQFKQANRVTQGAEKWLDLAVWLRTADCVANLRENGYRILTAHIHDATPIDEIDFSVPSAVVFGNERDGVSDEMQAAADASIVIPMAGFSRSFNISVAAALALYHIQHDRARRLDGHGDLSKTEQERLLAAYLIRHVEHAEDVLTRS